MTDAFAPLLDRGIAPATLGSFAVTIAGPYFRYPVRLDGRAVAYRLKLRPGFRGVKYTWDIRYPRRADLLYARELIEPGHAAFLCAGEPDCWLMHSIGLPAATFLAGEGAAPAPAVEQLVACRPGRVYVVYDNDLAGTRGAAKVARVLIDAGLDAAPLILPPSVGDGGDVCDLFRLCGFDRERFVAVLARLPVGQAAKPPRRRVGEPFDDPGWRDFRRRHSLVEAVSALTPLRACGPGRYRGLCPFHHEQHPSFYVYAEDPDDEHYHCFACQAHGTIVTLCQWLEKQKVGMVS